MNDKYSRKDNINSCTCETSCGCCSKEKDTLKNETNIKLSSGYNEKNDGNNSWTSVAQNYDIKESCKDNKKNEGNNQWCSTCK
ncbi:hypothetical protein [uncultured Clostridium sp.]|uniref:hypothetical protein n=1 Tax=uncultured Clostridium sp. TaxID=59620 RepID=UPI0025DB5778|nr:hypothetical protein [uncultured Clostridium sp.]